MADSLKEVTGPVYVLDFCEEIGFFVHKVDTGKRGVNLARLLMNIFSGSDRPPIMTGKNGISAFKAYRTLEEIKKHVPEVTVQDFNFLIPSLNKASKAVREASAKKRRDGDDMEGYGVRGGSHFTPAEQDELFQRMRKFFSKITPEPVKKEEFI